MYIRFQLCTREVEECFNKQRLFYLEYEQLRQIKLVSERVGVSCVMAVALVKVCNWGVGYWDGGQLELFSIRAVGPIFVNSQFSIPL